MKKLIFKANRVDKFTGKTYESGKAYEFEDERAEEILKSNCAILVEEFHINAGSVEAEPTKEETVEVAIKEEPKKEKAISKKKNAKK